MGATGRGTARGPSPRPLHAFSSCNAKLYGHDHSPFRILHSSLHESKILPRKRLLLHTLREVKVDCSRRSDDVPWLCAGDNGNVQECGGLSLALPGPQGQLAEPRERPGFDRRTLAARLLARATGGGTHWPRLCI